jgi:hypothetical protein
MGTHGRLFITFRRRHGALTESNGSVGGTHQAAIREQQGP